jgi:hypothetical protein
MKKDWHQATRRWLGRLSFTFLVVAFFLGYEGYRRYQILRGEADWKVMLDWFGATVSIVLAFTGLSERHHPG